MQKRCKRKVWPLVNPIESAILGCSIPSESRLDKLRIRELSAIESFSKGKAGPADFRDIADMLNVAETCGLMGIGPEALPVCAALEICLLGVKDQYEQRNTMILRPHELQLMRDLYSFHDAQRTAIDLSTYEKAIQKTANKIRGRHPKVKVLV